MDAFFTQKFELKLHKHFCSAIIISSYNNLLHNLCIKHKIAYIDNDCIDNSMLNRSNLHLNKNGDSALGSAFCAFLKPKQIPNYASNTSRNSGHFFVEKLGTSEERQVNVLPEAGKQGTKELNPNNLSSKHEISNFPETLNSIPNERGFKMAFLNIVTLPSKIDEIRHSVCKKSIDLIAFNETRLDQSISDGLINLNGYEVIRKDRSRNGGGVCIYIRSSINYKIRSDLIPPTMDS